MQANVNIRSSNIHLKAYLSEKIGCLSSVNLTPGSLDINLESSLFLIGGSDHQNLVDWFKFIWQRQSRATIFSNQNLDEFISRCLPSSNMEEFPRATSFLMPRQYYHDLVSSLKDFHGRVWIASRDFYPDAILKSLLESHRLQVTIVCAPNRASWSALNAGFQFEFLDNIHAKIVVLENKVAYVGGINFSFYLSSFALIDLMYKTKDLKKIQSLQNRVESWL